MRGRGAGQLQKPPPGGASCPGQSVGSCASPCKGPRRPQVVRDSGQADTWPHPSVREWLPGNLQPVLTRNYSWEKC